MKRNMEKKTGRGNAARRLLSLVLCVVMCLQLMPVLALGAEDLATLKQEKDAALAEVTTLFGGSGDSFTKFYSNFTEMTNRSGELEKALRAYYAALEAAGTAKKTVVAEIQADQKALAPALTRWADVERTIVVAGGVWDSLSSMQKTAYRNTGRNLNNADTYLATELVILNMPEEMQTGAESAWTALETAYTAYSDALKAVIDFRDSYYNAYCGGGDIYDAAKAGQNYATEQTSFTWSETGGTSHTDGAPYNNAPTEDMAAKITAAREALAKLPELLGAVKSAFDTFVNKLPGEASMTQIRTWKTTIEKWKTDDLAKQKDFLEKNTVEEDGLRYSKRIPHYDFDSETLFPAAKVPNSAADAVTYKENGLELAYYCDCEYSYKTGKSLSMSDELCKTLWEDGKVGTTALTKLAGQISDNQTLDDLDQARAAARKAWLALEANSVSNDIRNWTYLRPTGAKLPADVDVDAYNALIDAWSTAASTYQSKLSNYMTMNSTGDRAIYALEKLKALRTSYTEDYAAMMQAWQEAKAESNAQKAASVLEHRVEALYNQFRQVSQLASEGEKWLDVKKDKKENPTGNENDPLNPYDDEDLAKLTNATLGIASNATAKQRSAALCAYLQMQKMELTVWHDMAIKAIDTTTDAMNLDDTSWMNSSAQNKRPDILMGLTDAYSLEARYDLKEALVEWTAYEAYTAAMLENVEDALGEYSEVNTGADGSDAGGSSLSYDAALTAYNTAQTAYNNAKQETAAKQTALNSATADNYATASSDLQAAQEAEQKAKSDMEKAQEAIYDAAASAGRKLAEGGTYSSDLQAYRDSKLTEAQNALTTANTAYNDAVAATAAARAELTKKDTDVRNAEIVRSEAMDKYSDVVTELVEAKANLTAQEKEYGNTSDAYNAAKAAYDAVNARATAADDVLRAASAAYNTAVQARNTQQNAVTACQNAQDEARRAQTAAQDQVSLWQEQVTNRTNLFESVTIIEADEAAERYSLSSLEIQMERAEEEIAKAQTQVQTLYLELRASGFTTTGTPTTRGEKIYQFLQQAELLKGYRARRNSLEEAISTQYHPATLEGALAAARNAVANYYYAQREYNEFVMMEQNFINLIGNGYRPGSGGTFLREAGRGMQLTGQTIGTTYDPYGTKVYSPMDSNREPEAHALMMAGIALKEEYAARAEELKTAMEDAKTAMDAKLEELNKQEIASERTYRTEGEILQRQALLKVTWDEAQTAWIKKKNSLAAMENTLKNNLTASGKAGSFFKQIEKATYDIADSVPGEDATEYFFKEDMGAMNDAINAGWTSHPLTDTEKQLRDWLTLYASADYYNSFVEYTVAEAMFHDPDGVRQEMVNRIRSMGEQYALQVSTQSTNGNGILFFAVDYTDTDDFERKEYIFPFLDAYKNTMTEAGKTLAGAYGAASGEVADVPAINQDHINTMASLGQAGTLQNATPLSAWSSDMFLFRTQYKMKSNATYGGQNGYEALNHFELFVQRQQFKDASGKVNSNIKNQWSCSGIRLFKVKDFYGMSVYGYGGGPHTYSQMEFEGYQLGYVLPKQGGGVISWVTDDMISMGGGHGDDLYEMNHLKDTDGDKYNFKTEKVGPNSGGGTIDRVPDADSEYLIKLDFADHYGAGIEGLVNQVQDTSGSDPEAVAGDASAVGTPLGTPIDPDQKTPLKELGLTECLTLRLVYYDKNNSRRQVEVPLISSSVAWAIDHPRDRDISNEKIFGYAQQGTSIVLSAYLPEMRELSKTDSTLLFEYVDWTDWKSHTTASKDVQARVDGRKALIQADEQVELSGIQIYEPGTYTANAYVEQGVVKYNVSHKTAGLGPKYMITADRLKCPYASPFSLAGLDAYKNESETPLVPTKSWDNTYMMVIQTDEMPLAGTNAMPTVDLNYTTSSGRSKTVTAQVAQVGLDFYGYWPGVNDSNVTVIQALGAGGQLKLLYTVDDLGTFDSVRFNMPENIDDDWQVKGVYLQKVNSMGERFGVWENIFQGKNLLTDRRYDRLVNATTLSNEITEPILLQPGDQKIVSFENGDTPTVQEEEVDWDKIRFYMDEETAQSALGFTKNRESYTIRVQVNDEGASTVSDGDCGSVNNFYFQLVFANGRSAYVLANQQLSGDGFRTGYIETFSIKTNRDYGELQAVRIIPDDNSADSELFDKLNIKRIRVSRDSNDSISRTWVITDIGDNGWISFDYHDDAEEYSLLGRPGRAEAEIAVNCPVSYVTYSTKLLFALSTAQSDNTDVEKTVAELTAGLDPEKAAAIEKVLRSDTQYQGQLSMTLYYHNIKGNVEAMSVDVVDAMATYANKVADKEEKMDSDGNVITGSQYMSNKEYMFRVGHTDRFELDITDVHDLVSMDLIPTGSKTQSAFWKVASMSVSTIGGSGVLNLNAQDEYEKTNSQSGELLCTALGMPFTYWCPADNPEKMSFSFSGNELIVPDDDSSWEVAPARIPESSNDTANIYVYASLANLNSPQGAEFNKVFSQLQYTTVYGQMYKAPLREMVQYTNSSTSQTMFFTAGVDITNIAVLNGVILKLNSNQNSVVVDKVVVQQIRSGVVVATYTMEPPTESAKVTDEGIIITPNANAVSGTVYGTGGERQIVTVGFGGDTEPARLISQDRDVGIALKYTSTNDMDVSSGEKPVYTSPFIYLTDQDIVAISNGAAPQLIFHEQGVDEVTGVVAVATGGLKVTVTAASVQLQTGTTEGTTWTYADRENDPWFSVVQTQTLGMGEQTLPVWKPAVEGMAEKTVSPLTVTLTTGAQAPVGALEMVVEYTSTGINGVTRTATFPNIRSNLISGGFNAGQSATIRVMLGNSAERIEKISLRPVNANVSWAITSLNACLERTQSNIAMEGNATMATKDAPVEIAYDYASTEITFNVTASTVDSGGQTRTVSTAIPGAMTLNAGSGQAVSIVASVDGNSGEAVDIQAQAQNGSEWLDVTDTNLSATGENRWDFSSRMGYDVVYRITLTPALHPSKAVTLTINYSAGAAISGLRLNIINLTLTVGTGQYQLVETGGREVTWVSSDPSVVSVSETGLARAGENATTASTATITAVAKDGSGQTATCQVHFR